MKDFDKTKRAIRRASDSELKELHDNFGKYVGMANKAIKINAKTLELDATEKERAALAIQIYRERTLQMLEEEMTRRGIAHG